MVSHLSAAIRFCPPLLHPLWRRYAAVVGRIIIVAVGTSDLDGSAVISGGVISTRSSGTDRSSTDSGSTNAHRHAGAYTTIVATTVNATAIDTTAIICGRVSRNSQNKPDAEDNGCSERHSGSTCHFSLFPQGRSNYTLVRQLGQNGVNQGLDQFISNSLLQSSSHACAGRGGAGRNQALRSVMSFR